MVGDQIRNPEVKKDILEDGRSRRHEKQVLQMKKVIRPRATCPSCGSRTIRYIRRSKDTEKNHKYKCEQCNISFVEPIIKKVRQQKDRPIPGLKRIVDQKNRQKLHSLFEGL
jgi:hypothetical protein